MEKDEIKKWLEADNEEINGLTINGVLEEVTTAQYSTKIIPTKIIRKLKVTQTKMRKGDLSQDAY